MTWLQNMHAKRLSLTIAFSNDNSKEYEILLINLMENENVNKVVNLIKNNIKYNKN